MITDGTDSPEFPFMNNVQVNNLGIAAGDFAHTCNFRVRPSGSCYLKRYYKND